MPAKQVDGNDVFAVYEASREAADWCKSGKGPYFIEAITYRWREHVGPLWDWDAGYRSREEVESWIARDPIVSAARKLIAEGVCTEADIARWKQEAQREVDEAVVQAKASPFPDPAELLVGAY